MSLFSNNSPDGKLDAAFKKHHVYEVATSIEDSKHIAQDYSNSHRYQHRASVSVVGHPDVRPYDPIYLDGLPNGLSGYWTVLSVTHVFGKRPADYMLEMEVGTDYIGDVNPDAATTAAKRDIQGELSGQSLAISESRLADYVSSPNGSVIGGAVTTTAPTSIGTPSNVAVPEIDGITPFLDAPPDITSAKTKVQWLATTNGKVIP